MLSERDTLSVVKAISVKPGVSSKINHYSKIIMLWRTRVVTFTLTQRTGKRAHNTFILQVLVAIGLAAPAVSNT